jgi:hypothetical protein
LWQTPRPRDCHTCLAPKRRCQIHARRSKNSSPKEKATIGNLVTWLVYEHWSC